MATKALRSARLADKLPLDTHYLVVSVQRAKGFTHNAVDIRKPESNLKYRWCVERQWKLIVPYHVNVPCSEAELYQLKVDPNETRNLVAREPKRVSRLKKAIEFFWPVDD